MAELRLRVANNYETADLAVRFDDHTTIGQLAEGLERATDRASGQQRTLKRLSRGVMDFPRSALIAAVDLRSGDEVQLAIDSGIRSDASNEVTGAVLRFTAGPRQGQMLDLAPGEFTIGRSTQCEITLQDDLVSRRHAVFRVSDTLEIADAGSRNGIHVNNELISGLRMLQPGDAVQLGDTELTVEEVNGEHLAIQLTDKGVEFNRPPRIERAFAPMILSFPSPVAPLGKRRIPMVSALVPLVMGTVMYLVTRNVLTIMFIAMSPMLVLGNYVEGRRTSRREHAAASAEYEATMHDRRLELVEARETEIRSRRRFGPTADELAETVRELSPRLWEREPEHDDFLQLRVGELPQTSRITLEVPAGGSRDQRIELQRLVTESEQLPAVPIAIDLRSHGPTGVAGPTAGVAGLVRFLISQVAILHSPSELRIGALLSGDATEWDWLKWLPHTDGPGSLGLTSLVSVGPESGLELAVGLQQLIETRLADATADAPAPLPAVVVVIDEEVSIERNRLSALLELGAQAGVYTIWVSTDPRRVPNACQTVVTIEPGGRTITVGDGQAGSQTGGIPLETLSLEQIDELARLLAPVVDVGADRTHTADLPSSVSLFDLHGGLDLLDDPERTVARWLASRTSKALAAPVGLAEPGPLLIDLRLDGPHGLVGGTTGAGKSEFLQSFLASLALVHSHSRLNFLLVDYKGGSAFGDLVDHYDDHGELIWQGLPHAVGMITDLAPAMVQRALVSLQAELHRREVILNDHRAKDLMELERRGVPGTPANLLIVVDEFAALAKEVPEFVDGVVDIAQRGRSLGLHLLLATQKPGGVVTPNIQANTNLRIALRMATEEESRDVVRSPIAGRIDRSTPGRGVVRRGPTDLMAFQSAYVGATTTPSVHAKLELGEFTLEGTNWFPAPRPQVAPPDHDVHTGTDLRRIVRLVGTAAERAELEPARRPWLDPLPDVVSLLDLPRGDSDEAIPIGIEDRPSSQTRGVAAFRPDQDGSMLAFGMGGSGKTVFLRTLALSSSLGKGRTPVNVFGLDFAGRGLEMIRDLPHVGDIVAADDYDRLTRLLTLLRDTIDRRARVFAEVNAATLGEFRKLRPDEAPARILLLIDGYDAFTAAYERVDRGVWVDAIGRLVADGRSTGIHVVATGTTRRSFPLALSSQISSRLVLRLATDDDYHPLGASPSWFSDSSPAGRGRIGTTEVQIALVGDDPGTTGEAQAFKAIGDQLAGQVTSAPAIPVLPTEVARQGLPKLDGLPRWALSQDHSAMGPDLSQNVLISGPARSGKTTALASLAEALEEAGVEADVFASSPSPLLPQVRSFDELAARLDADSSRVILIDNAERIAGAPFEQKVRDLIAADQVRLVLAADSAHARGFDPTFKSIRARCDCLLLMPDSDSDSDLFGAPIPRSARVYPPGRGLLRLGDAVELCQIGLPQAGLAQ